jgi:hypothetical protein
MQKSSKLSADSDRKLIVITPIEGVVYYYIQELNLYLDVEMFKEKIVKKGFEYALNIAKKYIIKRINSLK